MVKFKLLPTNYLNVFDHSVGLALKGVKLEPEKHLSITPATGKAQKA